MSLLQRAEKELKEGELIGFKNLFFDSLSLWGENFFTILLTFVVPATALTLLLRIPLGEHQLDYFIALIETKAPLISIVKFIIFSYALRFIILSVATSLFWATLIYYFFNIINDGSKKWGESFNLAIPIFLRLALWMVIINLIGAIGLVLLIIPGIYLAVRYAFARYVVVLEKNVPNPLKKSWELTQGFGWHIIGYLVFLTLIYIVLSIPLDVLKAIFKDSFILYVVDTVWWSLFELFFGIFYLKFYVNLKKLKAIA